jgi:two-component system, chemotaxis family, protein-glutamate methylesterase/glutaminase
MMARVEDRVVHVLVVCDAPILRNQLVSLLGTRELIAVTAVDSRLAARQIEVSRPDVVLLDLPTSRLDGVSFLRRTMAKRPIPVVVCADVGGSGTHIGLRALDEGALEVVTKPRFSASGLIEDSIVPMVDAIRAAAEATLGHPTSAVRRTRTGRRREELSGGGGESSRLIAVGASMGGPEALATLLGALPEDAPGVVVVQHLPEAFTSVFARRLHGVCRIAVREAVDGAPVERGQALIAPGNHHLVVRPDGNRWRVGIVDGPLISRHRPSIDVLFRSVAEAAGRRAIGVILTGMGRDGADGLRAMKTQGAWTIAQDGASSVVFGMPREAIAIGAVDDVLPLSEIAPAIVQRTRVENKAEGA